jgi:Carboxypeptidase regulatory-like domain/TonB dependent receptor
VRIAFLAVLSAAWCWGQASSGSLIGDIADDSSKPLPGTFLSVQHGATGFSRSTFTDSHGGYRMEDLLPGGYTVIAQHAGFRKVAVSSILVEVDRKTRLDFTMRAGPESEEVLVTGNSSPLQTDEASAGYQLGAGVIAELPLSSRNIIELVTLGPGAIPRQLSGFTHDIINDAQANRGAVALNPPVNGARSTQNRYILDGGDNTDRNTFAVSVLPPLESVQEFRIMTSLPPAEFAQGGGAVIDVATKSGTRKFHGNAFEYFQNEAPDAKGFFEIPGLPRGIVRQNQYGATLGGPLYKSKTFFFASYEGLRGSSASATQHSVPTAAVRGGDFTGGAQIFDPLTLNAAGQRSPFPNNTIPLNRLDPNIQKYLAEFQPFPNAPSNPQSDFVDSTPNQDHQDNGSIRVDHAWGVSNRIFARYTINDERSLLAGAFPELPTAETSRAQQVVFGRTYAGSRWISETHLSFTRLRIFDLPESAFGTNVQASLGIQGAPTDPFTFGLPALLVPDYDLVQDSDTLPQTQRDNTTYFSSSVSRTQGRHTWKAGIQFTHFTMAYLQSQFVRGQYEFNGMYTQDPSNPSSTGDPFADFLLGDASKTTRDVGTTQAYLRQNGYAAFVQDEWRATSRISLTLGLRYEYNAPYTEDRGTLLNLNYSTLPAAPRLEPVKNAADPRYLNFAPRIGLAVRLVENTVFRAGYGIYYSNEIAIETYDLLRNGVLNEINQPGGLTPLLTWENGFPQTSSTGLPTYFGLDQNAKTPYVQQWAASLQHETRGHILTELAYVGTKGTDLGRFRRFNTPSQVELGKNLSPRPGDYQSLVAFPTLGTIFQREHLANSIYHSLQVKGEKRMSNGLAFLTSFVWAKSIDNADDLIQGQYESWGAQDERNLHLERGLSFFDVRYRFSTGFVYSIPSAPVLHAALKNWQLSGNVTLQTGTPLNPVYFATDYANSGTPNRPNIVPGQNLIAAHPTADQFYNPAAISAPDPFTFGNAGRDILPTPGNAVIDLSIHRRIHLSEHQTIEARGEAFNALNHPNIGIPLPYPDFGPLYGKTVSAGNPRHIQFALRYDF